MDDDKWNGIITIHNWKGKHAFLSNFAYCIVEYEGDIYASSEHAYQAAKAEKNKRSPFLAKDVTSKIAKQMGGKKGCVKMTPERIKYWETNQINIMKEILTNKFSKNNNPEFRAKLLATGWEPLEERNWWNDKFWGTTNGIGQNHLGKLLMQVREEAR